MFIANLEDLSDLFESDNQVIFLDTNFFITPCRSRMGAKPIVFSKYREYWLEPLFDAFSNLSIHETVYGGLVDVMVKTLLMKK